jgi:hypothetical protein
LLIAFCCLWEIALFNAFGCQEGIAFGCQGEIALQSKSHVFPSESANQFL